MLHKAHSLMGTKIHAVDGEMGHIDDFYFDDGQWMIRYMIVQTGSWFSSKELMLSPTTIVAGSVQRRSVDVSLSQAQVQQSPDLKMEMPVTSEQEMELVHNVQWPEYWYGATGPVDSAYSSMGYGATAIPGMGVSPYTSPGDLNPEITSDIYSTGISDISQLGPTRASTPDTEIEAGITQAAQVSRPGKLLHEVRRLKGYHVVGSDGTVGSVTDFLIDDEKWQVPAMLVDTTAFWPGGEKQVAMSKITGINWSHKQIHVNATRNEIKAMADYKA